MSLIDETIQTELKTQDFPEKSMQNLTTFNLFDEKYNNFRKFIEGLTVKHSEVIKVSEYLKLLPLQEFREMVIPRLMDALMTEDSDERSKLCEVAICKLMSDNGFNPQQLDPQDYSKLVRYCILFCVLISE